MIEDKGGQTWTIREIIEALSLDWHRARGFSPAECDGSLTSASRHRADSSSGPAADRKLYSDGAVPKALSDLTIASWNTRMPTVI